MKRTNNLIVIEWCTAETGPQVLWAMGTSPLYVPHTIGTGPYVQWEQVHMFYVQWEQVLMLYLQWEQVLMFYLQ